MKKEIFISYSWEDETHNIKVVSFTNFLRKNGFAAEMDRMVSQKETSIDFTKMMHNAIVDYEKIIIVLSNSYKLKAEKFISGVGKEYSLILNDIDLYSKKYIFIAFEEINDNIIPIGFKGREIIDLRNQDNYNKLFAKLQDQFEIDFEEVYDTKPIIKKTIIPDFQDVNNQDLFELSIKSEQNTTRRQDGKITAQVNQLTLLILNKTKQSSDGIRVELKYPEMGSIYNFETREPIFERTQIIDYKNRFYPLQFMEIPLSYFTINNFNVNFLIDDVFNFTIYSDIGLFNQKLRIKDFFMILLPPNYTENSFLNIDDFYIQN